MKTLTTTLTMVVLTLAAADMAHAQSGSRNVGGGAGGGIGGGGGGAGTGGGDVGGVGASGDFASTAAEGFARGQAAVIQSVGKGQLDASEAAVNYQEAARRWIENRVEIENAGNDILEARLDRVELANALREERSKRFRGLRDAVRGNQLRSQDYNRAVDPRGNVDWPRELQSNLFHEQRAEIEYLFAMRMTTTEVVEVEARLQDEIDAMERAWKSRIRTMKPRTYLAGKKFIGRLETELGLPPAVPLDVEPFGEVAMSN